MIEDFQFSFLLAKIRHPPVVRLPTVSVVSMQEGEAGHSTPVAEAWSEQAGLPSLVQV